MSHRVTGNRRDTMEGAGLLPFSDAIAVGRRCPESKAE
jgi:hypothetical protein